MKKLVKWLFGTRTKQCDIHDVSCSFIEGEKVIFDDGYNEYKVVIQGIWKNMATIVYEDGLKFNTHIGNLSKNCN